jgi:hypothetical protein
MAIRESFDDVEHLGPRNELEPPARVREVNVDHAVDQPVQLVQLRHQQDP